MTFLPEIAKTARTDAPSDLRSPGPSPRGLPARILVIEDEALVALEIQGGLEAAGHQIVGVADRVTPAATLARSTRPDLALVDVRLARGDNGIHLAGELSRLGVPCLFVTGNCPGAAGEGVAVACLHKPFDERQLVEAVSVVLSILRGGPPPPRLPMGMHLYLQHA